MQHRFPLAGGIHKMIPVYSYLLIYAQEIGVILQNTIIKF